MPGINNEQYEKLRQILVRVKGRPYTFEEARKLEELDFILERQGDNRKTLTQAYLKRLYRDDGLC